MCCCQSKRRFTACFCVVVTPDENIQQLHDLKYLFILVDFQFCKQAAISENGKSAGYVRVYKKMLFRRFAGTIRTLQTYLE